MVSHGQVADAARRARRTLYIIAGLYLVVGFILAATAAVAGDRVGAFLGFLIIGGALAAAVVVNAVLRLSEQLTALDEGLEDIHARLGLIEHPDPSPSSTTSGDSGRDYHCMLDLGTLDPGDPSALTAATLEHDSFPKLVATMEEEPPAEAGSTTAAADPVASGVDDRPSARQPIGQTEPAGKPNGLAVKNLLRIWQVALREGDVPTCRSLLSALGRTAPPESVSLLESEFGQLVEMTEDSLRAQFAGCVRGGEMAEALRVGQRICSLLPDSALAEQFIDLKPHLLCRLEAKPDAAPRDVATAR